MTPALGLLLGGLLLPATGWQVDSPSKPRRHVTLSVERSTWLEKESEAFDIEGTLKELLRKIGVTIVNADAPGAEASIRVRYVETEGREYKEVGEEGRSLGSGTEIDFELVVTLAGADEPAISITIDSGTPESFRALSPLDAAHEAFRSNELFACLPDLVAAALDHRDALPRLLPAAMWEDSSEVVREFFSRVNYAPLTARERAYIAFGERDLEKVVKLGKDSGEALLAYLGHYPFPGSGAVYVTDAIEALGTIGDARALEPLASRLQNLPGDLVMWPETVPLIGSLGKLGTAETLKQIEPLAENEDESIATAAREACEAIRKRLKGK